jgi:hypothetical protein
MQQVEPAGNHRLAMVNLDSRPVSSDTSRHLPRTDEQSRFSIHMYQQMAHVSSNWNSLTRSKVIREPGLQDIELGERTGSYRFELVIAKKGNCTSYDILKHASQRIVAT